MDEASTVWRDEYSMSFRFTNPRGDLLLDGETGDVLTLPYTMQCMDEAERVLHAMAVMDELFG